MTIATAPDTLIFKDSLDETASIPQFEEALAILRQQGTKDPIKLDFSGCHMANSTGIVTFLRFLEQSSLRVNYINSPTWLVRQLSLITQYLDNRSFVESLHVPYFCENDDTEIIKLMYIGKDIPVRDNYDEFVLPPIFENGKKFDPDVTPGLYFSFISDRLESFKHLEQDKA